uniref:small ribosomal subunit protein bS21m n=1 Tax=Myxine glutinosa TaxID=7769 RepID=UPI00358F747A
MLHTRFIGRTVMVKDNVEASFRLLNRLLTQDTFLEEVRRKRYYEKPCRRRQRESYEMCKKIYDSEMSRRIKFLSRKNRTDPWVGY